MSFCDATHNPSVSQGAAIKRASANNTFTESNKTPENMIYATLKQLLPYAVLALLGLYGIDLLSGTDLNQYRDIFMALIISLIMQPWIIYQLEN